jgi:hypothetical protein
MISYQVKYDVAYFTEAIDMAEKIIRDLKKEDLSRKLEAIQRLSEMPKLPRDEESRKLKIYKTATEIYKQMHIEIARGIMGIVDSNYAGIHDKSESYNYAAPNEPVIAAEAIKLLPNAFIGGPVKSAINSINPKVQQVAIEYFDTLPSDIRISEIFPKDFSILVKKLKAKLEKK